MKRLFAALKIQPDRRFLENYREIKRLLRQEPIKWVEEHNIHVTLKFFGETEEGRIAGINDLLRRRAAITSPVTLQLKSLGIFGSAYAPRVVWAGIEPFDQAAALMKNIHQDLRAAGFEPDRQNLVPHLTLGRIKSLRDKIIFNRTIDQFKTISSDPMTIGEMILFESILKREGPVYTALTSFPFQA